jgi:single-strand DNA-binding protein
MPTLDVSAPRAVLDPMRERTSNRVELVGYVGHQPETRYTPMGCPVTQFSLATHRWHEEDGQLVQETDWHTVVGCDELAKPCAALRPGDLVRVTGWLHTRTWNGRIGEKKRQTEVVLTGLVPVRATPVQPLLPLTS